MSVKYEKIGEIPVDAGLCWVGDPCYCVTPDCNSHPAKTWEEFCTLIGDDCPTIKQFESGVCVSSGYGDGRYPVYISRNKEGRIVRLLVKFD